jgi:hypothetical protein
LSFLPAQIRRQDGNFSSVNLTVSRSQFQDKWG